MCGFVGFTNKITEAEAVIEKMKNKIIHRGPDGEGTYIDAGIALGFRRLSIIDLENGAQPLQNEDQTLVLVFNGEIYNYEELRSELKIAGHKFRTESDSEVLIHGYEQEGHEFIHRLRGMFSFVIWDKEKEEIFAARDYFGIKPFYYTQMGRSFLFGSEVKGFLPHPDFTMELNEEALEQYLSFQYSPYEETFFKGVFKLPPAHYLTYRKGKLEIKRYWMIEFDEDESMDEEMCADKIEEAFLESVRMHKVSDVEVGSFLSSGIDSSYVACTADIDKTFTVGFDNGEKYNEISYAKELSGKCGITNISQIIDPEQFWEAVPEIQYYMDEPLADPAAAALYFVCKTASKHVKVVLSGEGADEIFAGYNVYKEPVDTKFYEKIPFFLRKKIGQAASFFPEKRGFNFLVRKGMELEERFIGNAYVFRETERKRILKIKTEAKKPHEICSSFYNEVQGKDDVTKMQYLDLHMWLGGDILLKADKMSMANSLELRVPFLDKYIMEIARKLPLKYRVNKKNTKYALRKAAGRMLEDKWAGKKKLGFPVPVREWLKEEKFYKEVKSKFMSENTEKYFHTEKLLELLNEHKDGKRDNCYKIWTVYSFLIWYEQYFT